jgi:hypothetical protein
MLHTYVDDNIVSVKNEVSTAYGGYLESHLGLHQSQMLGPELPNDIAADDKEFIVTAATERLFNGRGLIGTPEMCLEMIDTARGLDVDEIACLIDFGIGFQAAMASLERLASLKERLTSRSSV